MVKGKKKKRKKEVCEWGNYIQRWSLWIPNWSCWKYAKCIYI